MSPRRIRCNVGFTKQIMNLRDDVALKLLAGFGGVPKPNAPYSISEIEYRVSRAFELADEFFKQAGIKVEK